ncbi:MAG: NAD(P)/FAD-dependent oxidoreductase [Tatlockia sp.]|nr:NAD(P)/FAD-dependent oxidoreductase [Tatlockia sp.]
MSKVTIDASDCVVVGGGPAGLTAATYLARFRRNVVIFDTYHSRALKIPCSRNYPCFPQGIAGKEILQKLRRQLYLYKVPIIREAVEHLKLNSNGFQVTTKNRVINTKNVLLATGVEDIEPDLPNIKKGLQRKLIHHCPICDAYELINKRIAIIEKGKAGLEEALFIREYTPHITLINIEKDTCWTKEELKKIKEASFKVINQSIQEITLIPNALKIYFDDNSMAEFDSLYCALGCVKHNQLGNELKAKQKEGLFIVDKDQQTSVVGLYAAGDIVTNLHQLCVAEGQAAIAATAIHNRCRSEYD